MLCDSPLCRDGIVVISFTKSRKTPRHFYVLRLQAGVTLKPGSHGSLRFAFGIPASAVDGDYDVCMVATSASGLRGSKIIRVTLPEAASAKQ